MKVLVACEYSGIVRDAFIKKGHNAISCDLLDTDAERITGVDYLGGHYKGNVEDILYDGWDLMIAHPPCTYLAVSGAAWFYHPEDKHLPTDQRRPHPKHPNRRQLQEEALDFIRLLLNVPIDKIALENPVSAISTKIKKPNQIIQPYQFGHDVSKKTCLWLKNLPNLIPTKIVKPDIIEKDGYKMSRHHWETFRLPSKIRGKVRSRFYEGIAEAMANQWG